MARIFPSLAATSLLLFAVSVVLGLLIGDLYTEGEIDDLTWKMRRIHMLTGTATALAVVLVHSIAVTYFIGTSRWCKEVTETYRLAPEPVRQSTLLKRRTFPWCVLGMLTVVGVGALGAASDPGTGRPDTAWWSGIHQIGAFLGLVFVAWTYFRAWQNIVDNQVVIEQIVESVRQIRHERGLDKETKTAEKEALAAQ